MLHATFKRNTKRRDNVDDEPRRKSFSRSMRILSFYFVASYFHLNAMKCFRFSNIFTEMNVLSTILNNTNQLYPSSCVRTVCSFFFAFVAFSFPVSFRMRQTINRFANLLKRKSLQKEWKLLICTPLRMHCTRDTPA